MLEYEVEGHPDHNDSDDSARSLDCEFGVPIMRTLGVKKALTSTNEKLYRSSRAKTQVTRYTYNEYMAHFVYICISIYINIYIYICIYIHTYIHIYNHTSTHKNIHKVHLGSRGSKEQYNKKLRGS